MKTRVVLFAAAAVVAAACGGNTPGAKPHDMSMGGHEAAATQEDRNAELHAAQYDPKASTSKEHCPALSSRVAPEAAGACWTSVTNPTEHHRQEADQHRKMAADHRAALQALRDAEAKSCAGIADADRDMSPFAHREDITAVAPLEKGKGAVITFRAVPGMNAAWLQRLVDCHLARNAAVGHQAPEMPYCPLVPKGAVAKVTQVGDGVGLSVEVRDDEPAGAQEIWKRAQALKP